MIDSLFEVNKKRVLPGQGWLCQSCKHFNDVCHQEDAQLFVSGYESAAKAWMCSHYNYRLSSEETLL